MFRVFRRFQSTGSKGGPEVRKWLEKFTANDIPRYQFEIGFSRSSGPGGQKVNKTSSKATIKLLSVADAFWIPNEVKTQFQQYGFRYLTKSGGLVISDDTQRSREQNLNQCFDKLADEIKSFVKLEPLIDPADEERWSKIREKSNEKRLEKKKMASQRNKLRKTKFM